MLTALIQTRPQAGRRTPDLGRRTPDLDFLRGSRRDAAFIIGPIIVEDGPRIMSHLLPAFRCFKERL